jgi:predicted CXXCH cytochrome family protein
MPGIQRRRSAVFGDLRVAALFSILLLLGPFLPSTVGPALAAEESLGIGALSFTRKELRQWARERARAHDFPDIECEFCHSNEGLRLKLRTPDGKVRDFYVDPELSAQSIHYEEEMETCIDCHDDSCMNCKDPSHVASCFDCHDDEDTDQADARDSIAESVHGDFMRGDCAICHNPHYMKAAVDMTLTEKDYGCLACHEDKTGAQLDPLVLRHEWHPQASLHLSTIACIACHTKPDDDSGPSSFKHRILASAEAARECTECHAPEGRLRAYLEDIGEDAKTDLTEEEMLAQFYITGVTRDPRLDGIGLAVVALAIAGTLGHGLLRALIGRRR